MRRKEHKSSLSHKGSRLTREARHTGKAVLGLTPLGTPITILDIAKGTPRLVRATRVYSNALISEAKRTIKRRVQRNLHLT